MNKSFQPHDGHIPFLLQFFIDYNLYGMNLINLGAVKFRRSSNKGKGLRSTIPLICNLWSTIPKSWLYTSLGIDILGSVRHFFCPLITNDKTPNIEFLKPSIHPPCPYLLPVPLKGYGGHCSQSQLSMGWTVRQSITGTHGDSISILLTK